MLAVQRQPPVLVRRPAPDLPPQGQHAVPHAQHHARPREPVELCPAAAARVGVRLQHPRPQPDRQGSGDRHDQPSRSAATTSAISASSAPTCAATRRSACRLTTSRRVPRAIPTHARPQPPDTVARFDGGNQGYTVYGLIGTKKPAKWGEWNVEVAYRYLESDAVLDSLSDSDFHLGGTNAKGYTVGATMGLFKNVTPGWPLAQRQRDLRPAAGHRRVADRPAGGVLMTVVRLAALARAADRGGGSRDSAGRPHARPTARHGHPAARPAGAAGRASTAAKAQAEKERDAAKASAKPAPDAGAARALVWCTRRGGGGGRPGIRRQRRHWKPPTHGLPRRASG